MPVCFVPTPNLTLVVNRKILTAVRATPVWERAPAAPPLLAYLDGDPGFSGKKKVCSCNLPIMYLS
jgi:hypothetical protein